MYGNQIRQMFTNNKCNNDTHARLHHELDRRTRNSLRYNEWTQKQLSCAPKSQSITSLSGVSMIGRDKGKHRIPQMLGNMSVEGI